jgi:hypothetical protein
MIKIFENDDFVVDYDKENKRYRVSYFEDCHFKDEFWFNAYEKKILRSPADKIAIYKEMQDSIKSIYTMIFDDLDILFYGLE